MVIPQPSEMISWKAFGTMEFLCLWSSHAQRMHEAWQVVSGHRRLTCAIALGLGKVPCEVRTFPSHTSCQLAVLEYNRQRQKNFSQMMREADAFEELWRSRARSRRLANLRRGQFQETGGLRDLRSVGIPTIGGILIIPITLWIMRVIKTRRLKGAQT